jgi:hypothetical protein
LLLTSGLPAAEFHVGEFGAVGDGVQDDGPALREVFARAGRAEGPSTIVFEEGKTYFLASHDVAHGRLLLHEARHVTVEGSGALLLIEPPNRALGIYRSSHITVRNLQIDYRPVPYVQGNITRIDNARGFLEFKPHPGYLHPIPGDDSLYRDGRNDDSVTLHRESRKFYHAHSRVRGVEALGDGRFRVSYRGHRFTEARVGDFFAMKNRWRSHDALRYTDAGEPGRKGEYISTGDPSISVAYSDNVLLENIRSYAAPGMTLNVRGGRNLVVQGLRIQRREDRLVAGCSDGLHIKCGESQPVIRDCHIEATMDDSIHVKISGDWITEVASPRRVRIRHMDIAWDNTNLGRGKRVLVYDHDDKREVATAFLAEYEAIDHRTGWVTLDRDVPEMGVKDSLYLEAQGEALIERCSFGTQLQRAILTHQPTRIRDCLIQDNGQGIVVSFTGIEGPPSQRLHVERCTFSNLKLRAIYVQCPSTDYDQKGDPQFICSDSTFRLPPGVPAFEVIHSRGVSLRNNRYVYCGTRPALEDYRILTDSPLLEDRDNIFVPATGAQSRP